MNLQDIASSLMQPSDNDNVVADHEAVKAFRQQRTNLSHASGAPSEPCLGASLRFLCLLIFLPAFFLDLIENFSNPERSFRVLGLSSAIIPYAVKRSHTLFLVPSLFRSMTANPRVIHRNLRSSRLDVFDKQLLAVNEVVDEMLCQQKPE